eukprot:c5440_g1_i1.p1 GENE.c5440_g1_i1~~c5440_g1_i1.p1  ORF type:complete len:307 (+),score=70.55 c5440_g1_i1:36-956(+)
MELVVAGLEGLYGLGKSVDYARALKCFEEAEGKGYAPAAVYVARVLRARPEKDSQKIEEQVQKAIKMGIIQLADETESDFHAWWAVGWMAVHGIGVAEDRAIALKWFLKAAERGHPGSQFDVGLMYEMGIIVEKDMVVANHWYQLAAVQGVVEAQFNLGLNYMNGNGVPTNTEEAIRLFNLAAEQGDPDAQCMLGWAYRNEPLKLVDYGVALNWYRRAAAQGHIIGEFNFAMMLIMGFGCDRAPEEGMRWLHKAAVRNVDARFQLGRFYLEGTHNEMEGFRWIFDAAELQNPAAVSLLKDLKVYVR